MKKSYVLLALLVISMLLTGAIAAKDKENTSDDTNTSAKEGDSDSIIPDLPNITLPDVNTTEVGKKLENATQTGIEPVDDLTSFLANASPFLLLIAGILIIVLAGFGKIIGIVLIILALLRFIQMFFF